MDRESGELFAIKILKANKQKVSHISNMWREVDALSSLRDERVVKYFHSFPLHHKSSLAIVMEYLPGGDLKQFLKESGGRVPEATAQKLFIQMCEAVKYFHSRKLIHRDLKL